jgi:uncharacterized protein
MSDALSTILKSSSQQSLGALRGMIMKAETHARALKVDDAVLLAARLYPDMLGATRQVQIACDTAARGAARLSGMDTPSFPDVETDFPALLNRCDAAIAFVAASDAQKIDANDAVTLQIPMATTTMQMTGRNYLTSFVLPNLHFHAAIFYALMRQQGVPVGKMDFLVAK